MSFFGYVRPDGSVGTRNYVLVIPQGLIAKAICDFVAGTRMITTVDHGSGRTGNDRERIARVLIGLGRNPNVASVIVHAASPGVQYAELTAERLADEIRAGGKRVEIIDPARDGGVYAVHARRCVQSESCVRPKQKRPLPPAQRHPRPRFRAGSHPWQHPASGKILNLYFKLL